MTAPFSIGDVVKLKSGGQRMTVLGFRGDDILCCYCDSGGNMVGYQNDRRLFRKVSDNDREWDAIVDAVHVLQRRMQEVEKAISGTMEVHERTISAISELGRGFTTLAAAVANQKPRNKRKTK